MAARNPIAQANIPSVKNAHVDIDLSGNGTFAVSTALESQITEVNVSGGDFNTTDLPVLDGTVFTSTGDKQAFEVTVTAVYTDGESPDDLHPLVWAKHGQSNIGLRWKPKGATSRSFSLVGVLFRVMPPNLARNGDILYSFALRGDISAAEA
jgi:hypothetical protein